MPASKPDLSTIHGRLQYARERRGYTRQDFAKDVMGYSMHGWAKIELGVSDLTADMLQKANEELKLDERYYFGRLSFEEAEPSKVKTVEDLGRRFEAIQPSPGDPLLREVAENPTLRRLVGLLRNVSESRLAKIADRIGGYLEGVQDAEAEREPRVG